MTVDKTGKLVYMSPDEYISMVSKDGTGIGGAKSSVSELVESRKNSLPKRMEYFDKQVVEGKKIPALSIDYGEKSVQQEGIHRALWAKERGIKQVPVITNKSQPLQEGVKIAKPELGKPTKASRDINRSFAIQGLKEIPTEDLAKYTPQKKVDVVQRVSETMGDVKKSNRMALGLEDAPSGVDKTVLFNSVFNRAVKTGDIDLQRALAKSPIAEEASLRGQALGAAGYIRRNVVLEKLQDIVKTRKDAIVKKFGKNTISKEVKSAEASIKNKIAKKMPTKEDWTNFITDITC
jgi:hypothetical protein